jgi:cysteine synthase
MARFLVQRDGLFLGSSSAVKLVACIKLVRKMGWGNGEKAVTVLCVFSYPLTLPKTFFGERASN